MISILGHDFFILNSLVLAEASSHHPIPQQSLWKAKQMPPDGPVTQLSPCLSLPSRAGRVPGDQDMW